MKNKLSTQNGFTLVELVIAIAIAALIVAASFAAWFQFSTVSARNSDYMAAYNQVQNAGYWFSRDAVQITQEPTLGVGGFPATLCWVDWDGSTHRVVYTLDGGTGELRRTYGIDGALQENFVAAQYVDSTNTGCTWDGETLSLKITAQFGDRLAERTYTVEPRTIKTTL